MTNYFTEAKALIEHSRGSFENFKSEYDECLRKKTIQKTLLIDIKNILENLRSALDYCSHGLYEKYGDKKNSRKIPFQQGLPARRPCALKNAGCPRSCGHPAGTYYFQKLF